MPHNYCGLDFRYYILYRYRIYHLLKIIKKYSYRVHRPNQDECPGYEYYNVMTTNRWQDDKVKGSPAMSTSSWPCKNMYYHNILIYK